MIGLSLSFSLDLTRIIHTSKGCLYRPPKDILRSKVVPKTSLMIKCAVWEMYKPIVLKNLTTAKLLFLLERSHCRLSFGRCDNEESHSQLASLRVRMR
ncbi:hypothetical protein ALC57_08169 [Trachymyrmex cornetzi]|uniref:Uncharacterized protein n=1 Tax=Trachymyrmex cornetzi TaxID=471704 RepID=A0A195E3H9_9HYME|nr:hypothetical protein ALC57_08169 [Trachymyrmex cornetzi]